MKFADRCLWATLLVAIASLVACASPGPERAPVEPTTRLVDLKYTSEQLIIGGRDAKPGEVPWQAALIVRKSDGDWLCGGTVIAPGWVLTAAHCVEDEKAAGASTARPAIVAASDIQVRTTSLYVDRDGVLATADRLVLMPRRNPSTKAFDVALLKVRTDASAGGVVLPPIAPTPDAETLAVGTTLRISGYGRTAALPEAPVLQLANVKYIRRLACNTSQGYGGSVDASMLCAGVAGGTPDSCQGDSGGPLVRLGTAAAPKNELVGVVSWGEGCADPDHPGVYANVSHPDIGRWIRESLR